MGGRGCFVCGASGDAYARQIYWGEHEFDVRWCSPCRVGWVATLPDPAVFVDGYERFNVLSWTDRSPRDVAKDVRRAYLKGARVGSEFLRRRRVGPGTRVLEVGSNIGVVLKGVMDRLGLAPEQVVGIDFSRNHAEVSREKFGIRTLAETLGTAKDRLSERFDLIVCHHIIEHDDDPGAFLASIKALLKPGGLVSFELPNGLREARCIHHDGREGRESHTRVNHINFFSPKGFHRLLRIHRFRVLHLSTLNTRGMLHDYGIVRRHLGRHGPVLRLSEVPNESVLPTFDDAAISRGIDSARRISGAIGFVHRRLRIHYPAAIPLGRDIEALAENLS